MSDIINSQPGSQHFHGLRPTPLLHAASVTSWREAQYGAAWHQGIGDTSRMKAEPPMVAK